MSEGPGDADRIQQIVRDALHADVSLDVDVATLLAEEAVRLCDADGGELDTAELARRLMRAHPALGASAASYVAGAAVRG